MNREQEKRYAIALQLVDYYSTADKYIRSQLHSNAHQSVFTKESDKYQWLVLEQKSQSEIEVRQTDNHGKQIINSTLKKLNALSEETCAELTATTKRRKITERDHSIRSKLKQAKDACLAKAKEQSKQPTVAEGKKHRTHSRGKGNMVL